MYELSNISIYTVIYVTPFIKHSRTIFSERHEFHSLHILINRLLDAILIKIYLFKFFQITLPISLRSLSYFLRRSKVIVVKSQLQQLFKLFGYRRNTAGGNKLSKTDFTFTQERKEGRECLAVKIPIEPISPELRSLAIVSIDLGTAAASRAVFRRTHGRP